MEEVIYVGVLLSVLSSVPLNIQAGEVTRLGGSQERRRRFLCRLAEEIHEDQRLNACCRIVFTLNSCMIPNYSALIPCVLKV